MLEYASLQEGHYDDPVTLGSYGSVYYFFKEMGLDAQAILERFNSSNDTVKQYVQLSLFNDGMLSEEQKLGLIDKLTYPPYKEYALQLYQDPNRGIIKSGYINNEIRDARLFDVNDKELAFDELFNTTAQSYLLLDFSGSWCKPCLEEMSVYAKTAHLDNSKKVRPIWLFFENDKTKWLNVVERYNLKKENCFLVVGESGNILRKQFTLLFDWEGEFPHYFLFAKEGEIIDKRARPLSIFEENDVDNLPSRVKNKNSGPPLPPPIKTP
jgi:thiol-disulfide isomerase/thioredoxin